MFNSIEFTGTPEGEVEVRMPNGILFILEKSHREFISEFIELLIAKRPIAYEALENRYAKSSLNVEYYEFLIVRGFIKCNFIMFDNHMDIDSNSNFKTEFILCPRTGECPECGLVCNSPVNSDLTPREIDVLRLIVQGYDNLEIADMLYISINTVHNHRNNMLRKLGRGNTAGLVRYWYETELK